MKTTLWVLAVVAVLFIVPAAFACGTCGCQAGSKAGSVKKGVVGDEYAEGQKIVESLANVCRKCGEERGSEKCCAEDAVKCKKCGLHKGSPGCCNAAVTGKGTQALCPIKGLKINRERYVDHEGKRVYFCCPGCDKEFLKDPDKHIEKMEAKGIVLEKVAKPQDTCPVMGAGINKKLYADHEGKRVYFCCKGCVAAFTKDPQKYIDKLESEGVQLEKVAE